MLPTSGEIVIPSTTIIDGDDIDNNISLVASDANMDFSLQSHSKIVDQQLPIEDATNETIFATKIDPSSVSEEDRSIELERADDVSKLNTSQIRESLVTSDVDLSLNEVIVINNDTSHNVTEMQQPALSSNNSVLKTDATKNVSNISTLQSMNESELLFVIPEGVNIQTSADEEGASIVGIDPDLIISTEVESVDPDLILNTEVESIDDLIILVIVLVVLLVTAVGGGFDLEEEDGDDDSGGTIGDEGDFRSGEFFSCLE